MEEKGSLFQVFHVSVNTWLDVGDRVHFSTVEKKYRHCWSWPLRVQCWNTDIIKLNYCNMFCFLVLFTLCIAFLFTMVKFVLRLVVYAFKNDILCLKNKTTFRIKTSTNQTQIDKRMMIDLALGKWVVGTPQFSKSNKIYFLNISLVPDIFSNEKRHFQTIGITFGKFLHLEGSR